MPFDLWTWLQESGALGNAVGGVIAAVAIGVAALIPKSRHAIGRGIVRAWRFISSVRITTTNRHPQLASGKSQPVVRVRWAASLQKSNLIQLANTTPGSVARNVSVDANARDAQLFGQTDFQEIPPLKVVGLMVRLGESASILGVDLYVSWDNERGERQFQEVPVMGLGF